MKTHIVQGCDLLEHAPELRGCEAFPLICDVCPTMGGGTAVGGLYGLAAGLALAAGGLLRMASHPCIASICFGICPRQSKIHCNI